MGLVHDREDASPAGNELMSRDLVDLERLPAVEICRRGW